MTNTTKIIKQIITDTFTSATVNVNKTSVGWMFKVDYFNSDQVVSFIKRRFSDVVFGEQTSNMVKGYFKGIK